MKGTAEEPGEVNNGRALRKVNFVGSSHISFSDRGKPSPLGDVPDTEDHVGQLLIGEEQP